MVGLGYFISAQERNSRPVGFLDNSDIFENPISLSSMDDRSRIDFIQYFEVERAVTALSNREIQAYFIIPKDYPENKNIDLYFNQEPGENAFRDAYDFLQLNLLSDSDSEIRNRVALGSNIILRTPDGTRSFPNNQPSINNFLPLIISFGFVLLLMISSGFLMSSFLEEKSNRTIELIVTSLSPAQFVGSKLATVFAIGFTMVVTWILVGLLVLFVGNNFLHLDWMHGASINWLDVLMILIVTLPSYVFICAVMLAIGLILGNNQEAESIGPIFFVLAFIPLWFIIPISRDINGPLAVILSVIPITSLLTVGFRSMFIQIPYWQVLVSFAIQSIFVFAAIWLLIRAFRIGILRTGKRIRWNELRMKVERTGREASG